MPRFTITGDIDPFLHVSLSQNERIYCESDAMVMMDASLDLKGKMKGGLGAAIMRKFANDESFFQQEMVATRGEGDCLLAPTLPGAMQVLDIGPRQYMVSDGAFVAATADVGLNVRMQSIGNALFAQTGGFFITESSGNGQMVVSGFGTIFELAVAPGKDVLIDNSHVVAWDNRLRYDISASTSASSGFLSNLVNSQMSGEGVVLRFSGEGKVLVCSRNKGAFLDYLRQKIKAA